MRVSRKTVTRLYSVLIDHSQTTKGHVIRIMVLIKRERVIRVEPAKVEVAAIFGLANCDHQTYPLVIAIESDFSNPVPSQCCLYPCGEYAKN